MAWWFGHSGTRLSRSSGPPLDRGRMWWTSTTCEKPQITQESPYAFLASVRQCRDFLGSSFSFRRCPSRPHAGEQYWSARRLRAFGTTLIEAPQMAQATVTRLYELLFGPVRCRLSSSRHRLEQYTLPFMAAAVRSNVWPQNWHVLWTRGLNLTLLLCPEMKRRPSPAYTPQPHSQNPITMRRKAPCVQSFQV